MVDLIDLKNRTELNDNELDALLHADAGMASRILTGISIPDDKMMEHLNELNALLQSDKYAGLPSAFIHRKLMTVNDDIGESDWHELIK